MSDVRRQFEWHVLRHFDDAYDVAWWYLQNRQDVEDAVQDSVLRAYESFASFRGVDGRPWFFRIVRNRCLRILEERKRESMTSLESDEFEPISTDQDPEAHLISQASSELVRNAIAELQAPFREILVLRELHQQSYAQISEITGIPVGTVMSRLSRARAIIAKRLREVHP